MKNIFLALVMTTATAMAIFTIVKVDDPVTTVPDALPNSPTLWLDGDLYKIRLESGDDIFISTTLGGSSGNLAADYAGLTPVSWAATQNDVVIPSNSTGWETTLTGNQEINGIAGGSDGNIFMFYNTTGGNLKFKRDNANSSVGNRFATPDLADYDLKDHGSVYVRYDAALFSGAGGWHLLDNKP